MLFDTNITLAGFAKSSQGFEKDSNCLQQTKRIIFHRA